LIKGRLYSAAMPLILQSSMKLLSTISMWLAISQH